MKVHQRGGDRTARFDDHEAVTALVQDALTLDGMGVPLEVVGIRADDSLFLKLKVPAGEVNV